MSKRKGKPKQSQFLLGRATHFYALSLFLGLEENEDDLYLDYTMLPADLSKNYNVDFDQKQTLFIKRWKPDDLRVFIACLTTCLTENI
jgi:hypothetical protein